MSLKEDLETIKQNGLKEIDASTDVKSLNEIRVQLLGKKGPITQALRGISKLPVEERPVVGSFANTIRDELATAITTKQTELENAKLNAKLDILTNSVNESNIPVIVYRSRIFNKSISVMKYFFAKFGLVDKL